MLETTGAMRMRGSIWDVGGDGRLRSEEKGAGNDGEVGERDVRYVEENQNGDRPEDIPAGRSSPRSSGPQEKWNERLLERVIASESRPYSGWRWRALTGLSNRN
jgi:hypothetical protein